MSSSEPPTVSTEPERAASIVASIVSSIAASIATLGTALSTLAQEGRATTLEATFRSLSDTITSLAGVIATLSTPPCDIRADIGRESPVSPLGSSLEPTNKNDETSKLAHAEARIKALETALTAVESEAKIRTHHQRIALGAKYKRMADRIKHNSKSQLAVQERANFRLETECELEINFAVVQEVIVGALRQSAIDMEIAWNTEKGSLLQQNKQLATENKLLTEKTDALIKDNAHLQSIIRDITYDKKRLQESNESFSADMELMTSKIDHLLSENGRLTSKNGLKDGLLSSHEPVVRANEDLG
ncbi:hypothetical protein CC85DRAFT_25336 [Cutaneotrichosporon oleaginosum]|uniref:Uncharacterized protein n=1 Tax=Cutaneotrichosporon oleaginosum TaxID=879819 RepID=A0A0J0XT84_9TREE|nr:uncharacterized protein CC85DRAFT_25336 [Cutaneotrichosporon oleaginosum]KLT44285.1 hypothetical protein CC85DRAFT_25336 [Cutaneotrichosporon oleaginosum]